MEGLVDLLIGRCNIENIIESELLEISQLLELYGESLDTSRVNIYETGGSVMRREVFEFLRTNSESNVFVIADAINALPNISDKKRLTLIRHQITASEDAGEIISSKKNGVFVYSLSGFDYKDSEAVFLNCLSLHTHKPFDQIRKLARKKLESLPDKILKRQLRMFLKVGEKDGKIKTNRDFRNPQDKLTYRSTPWRRIPGGLV